MASSEIAVVQPIVIGASKGQSVPRIERAIVSGICHFGENRVQEAQEKWPGLKRRYPELQLHLIGSLQSNKAKEAISLFDAIHTLDRLKLADALALEMDRQGRRLPCFIQVNTGEEEQKSGVLPSEADNFIRYCKEQTPLNITGLICVPPAGIPPAPHFALLHEIAKRHGLPHLSMGMSDDYETAIRFGATHVRIGRALFGERG